MLSKLVAKAGILGIIEGCSMAADGPSIPQIQYADDSLFFLKEDGRNSQYLRVLC